MDGLAPIGVSTYTRLEHLKQTIGALKNNYLSKESDLYVFSDGPRKGDEQKVADVRSYVNSLDGFKSISLIVRKENNRVFNNRNGMQSLLENHGKMIWLEEDIITSPYFLSYMNEVLDTYHNVDKVISISGYCPPIRIPNSYKKDVFLLKRFNAWGFGTWKHKFDPWSFSINKKEYVSKIDELNPILEKYGRDVPRMVKREAENELDALDVKVMYHQAANDLYTVYPVKSLAQNIGFDGSGLHSGDTRRFNVNLASSKIEVDRLTSENDSIIKENRNFRNQTGKYYYHRIFNKLRKLLNAK